MLRENWNDAGPGFHPVSASDYLPAAQLRELQLRRLKHIVGRAYAHVPGQSHRHVMNPSTSARNSSDAEAISLLFFIPTLLVVLRRNRFITIWRTIARLLAAKPLRVRDWSSAS